MLYIILEISTQLFYSAYHRVIEGPFTLLEYSDLSKQISLHCHHGNRPRYLKMNIAFSSYHIYRSNLKYQVNFLHYENIFETSNKIYDELEFPCASADCESS